MGALAARLPGGRVVVEGGAVAEEAEGALPEENLAGGSEDLPGPEEDLPEAEEDLPRTTGGVMGEVTQERRCWKMQISNTVAAHTAIKKASALPTRIVKESRALWGKCEKPRASKL
jgi:hypothetical protein